jgi:CheY-like chemotaxis protein
MRSAKKSASKKEVLPPADSSRKVLVVSDNPTMREAITSCLRGIRCAVDAVSFGEHAQDCYRSSPYRLIVVDLPDPEPGPEAFHELVCMLSAAPCEAGDDPLPERVPFAFDQWSSIHPNIENRPAFILLASNADKETHGQAFLHEQLIGALSKPVRKDYLTDLAEELMNLGNTLRAERMGYELQ